VVIPAQLRLVVLAFGMLAGCAAAPAPEASALIAPELRFAIPSPRELGYRVDASQLVTAHFRGDTQVFEAHLTVLPERLTFVGLDPFGRRALTVISTDAGITIDAAPWLPAGLRPQNILADVAIMYWPEEAVRRGLAGTAAVLRADAHERSITANGQEIIHVEYGPRHGERWAAFARYRNIAFGYELDLQSAVTPE
jgi:Protein of unknown function (DUF3261)